MTEHNTLADEVEQHAKRALDKDGYTRGSEVVEKVEQNSRTESVARIFISTEHTGIKSFGTRHLPHGVEMLTVEPTHKGLKITVHDERGDK